MDRVRCWLTVAIKTVIGHSTNLMKRRIESSEFRKAQRFELIGGNLFQRRSMMTGSKHERYFRISLSGRLQVFPHLEGTFDVITGPKVAINWSCALLADLDVRSFACWRKTLDFMLTDDSVGPLWLRQVQQAAPNFLVSKTFQSHE